MTRRVLHLDTESTWRGGENQLRLLVENAPKSDWIWYLAAPPDSEIVRRLASSMHIFPTPMRGVSLLSAAWKLARLVQQEEIQLIDCQSSRAHNLGLLIKWLVPQCRLIVHRRVDYPPGRTWFNRRKYLSPLVDAYICISEAIAAVLSAYGVPADRLHVVRSAVDPGPFRNLDRVSLSQKWRKEWGLSDQVPVIGNVAYLTDQKDHLTLVRALGQLKQRGLPFFCYIAGEGPLESVLKAEAERLHLGASELRFLGLRRDIPELLAATDIFALSSRDEGLGTSLLDATHSGCALVATAAGGIPEIVKDGQTGLLSPVGDASVFAEKLALALHRKDLRDQWVQAAQELATQRFSLSAMVAGNLQIYHQLVAQQ